jgi:C-terminal processing protease CtpA/Prc
MQEKHRAQIVGTQSRGCVLGVLKHRELKGGGELAISEVAFVTLLGRKLEGDGVVPDRKVALTLTDRQRQRDTALEETSKQFAKENSVSSFAAAPPHSAVRLALPAPGPG